MIDRIINVYADGDEDMRQTQRIQTAHRLKLIEAWGIQEGDHVLEIGCGQGDTTVALAFSVGETGFVHGVDIAPGSYGAPETLEQARERIRNSSIGGRVQIDFDFDITRDGQSFAKKQFDCVVLSHCLWYFSSFDELVSILSEARKYAKSCVLRNGIQESPSLSSLDTSSRPLYRRSVRASRSAATPISAPCSTLRKLKKPSGKAAGKSSRPKVCCLPTCRTAPGRYGRQSINIHRRSRICRRSPGN